MKEDDLRVNQLIKVEMDYNGERIVLPSRIEGIEGDYLLIAMPIRSGMPLLVPSGCEITVQFRSRDRLLGFQTEVISRRLRPVPVWITKKPVQFFSVDQKRNFVRLAVNLPLCFQYLERNDDTVYQGLTVDISGGGILFSSSHSCQAGEKIKVEFPLGDDDNKVTSIARVVRIFDKDEKVLRGYRVAVEFEDMTDTQRDRIFKFVFDKQREWICKGLFE